MGPGRAGRDVCSQVASQAVRSVSWIQPASVPLTYHRVADLHVSETATGVAHGDRLTQPCETLRRPWSYTDQGAEWMYSPPQVSRIA